jgi:tetratricopeptide (TPR) repeat protein
MPGVPPPDERDSGRGTQIVPAGEAGERWRELSGDDSVDVELGYMAATVGDHQAAAAHLRRYCDLVEARDHRNLLSTSAPMLGRSLWALGRYDEAEPLARLGRELGDEQDAATQAFWRQVQAVVHANHRKHVEAEQLAREAVGITERTDALNMQGDTLCDLAEVLATAGRTSEAVDAFEHRYERKKNLAIVAQVRPKLEALRGAR